MKDNVKIGRQIAQLRQEKDMTQTQLATILGVSRQAVSKWESGQALPDIAVMLELTRMFGITIESLIDGDEQLPVPEHTETGSKDEGPEEAADKEKTNMNMNYNELMQMAPYMSKEAVGEIALKLEGQLSSWQIAKLAPFVRQEVLEQLVEKHHPEMRWDTLRRLAPFMSRETVDRIAREISEGTRHIHPTTEDIDKAMDDIGRTFDDIGKGMGKTFDDIGKGVGKAFDDIGKGVGDTVQRVLKFGGSVFNDVSDAISDLATDLKTEQENEKQRSERGKALRRRALERALEDGRFDWIADHMDEVDDDDLKARIATAAREHEMFDWLAAHMPDYADEQSVRSAIDEGNWDYLGENAWKFEPEMQEMIAKAAVTAENWDWLESYSDLLQLNDCAIEIARAALNAGKTDLVEQICKMHLDADETDALALEMMDAGNSEAVCKIIDGTGDEVRKQLFLRLAENGEWQHIEACIASADDELKETLTEKAIDQGNFEAVDMIDRYM